MSKNGIYNQMPVPPLTGIGASGTDTFSINPSGIPGNISRIRSIYIDLPTSVTLNINLSSLGAGDDDIVSNGNEAGSIIFRDGITFSQPVTITVTGAAGTPYSVRLVTEVEVPETQRVEVSNFPTPPEVQRVDVANFPSLQGVLVTNFPQTPASQKVEVTNFPSGGLGGATVQQAGIPMWLALGLAVGFVYMAYKSSKEKEKYPTLVRER